jgi:hypothetical protein
MKLVEVHLPKLQGLVKGGHEPIPDGVMRAKHGMDMGLNAIFGGLSL